jgi:hypothetical protein
MAQRRPDPRLSVRPGQPISIAADQINWLNRQMKADKPAFRAGPLGGTPAPYSALPVKNTTGSTVARGSWLRITGLAHEPTGQFDAMPVLLGDHVPAGQLVIPLEPIKAGKIGRCAVDGYVQATMDILHADHRGVATTVSDGSPKSAWAGMARIVWREGVGEGKKALLYLGYFAPLPRLCKSGSTTFAKGTVRDLDVYQGGTPPDESSSDEAVPGVVNKYANIGANKWVSVALHGNGYWYVVAAEC